MRRIGLSSATQGVGVQPNSCPWCGRLREDLRKGICPDRRGAVHVELGDGLTAICYPAVGRWEVATVKIWGGLSE